MYTVYTYKCMVLANPNYVQCTMGRSALPPRAMHNGLVPIPKGTSRFLNKQVMLVSDEGSST
jgi:hypothetical protein